MEGGKVPEMDAKNQKVSLGFELNPPRQAGWQDSVLAPIDEQGRAKLVYGERD